jgi:FAD-dependent sensor of blue light
MKGLVYISKSNSYFQNDELEPLIDSSAKKNIKDDITGYISYDGNGTFIQYIEGEDERINALFDLIYKDNRHRVTHFVEKEINDRRFPLWNMRLLEEHHFKAIHDIMISHLFHLSTTPDLAGYKNKLIWSAVDSIADNKI